MSLLLRLVRILDPRSKFHKKKVDVLIVNGAVERIGKNLRAKDAREIEGKALHLSPGWLDMQVNFCDPGFEYKEDLDSGMKAAARGGFTAVAVKPSTLPVIDSKAQVEYIKNKSKNSIVNVYPIAALTKNFNGKDLTEMQDLHKAGAIAFSQGNRSISDSGIMLRSLQYVKSFDGIVFQLPDDPSISNDASINESKVSVQMGMKGRPAISEEVMVNRDLQLLRYAESRLHFSQLSSAGSVELIKKAKKEKLDISASVSPYHLIFDERAVSNFDTSYKFNPPLRGAKDRKVLVNALRDGHIDVLTSVHSPHEDDAKKVEFESASFGLIGLETLYALVNTELGDSIDQERIAEVLANNPRRILDLETEPIAEGASANFTLFDSKESWTFTTKDIGSKSRNTPFLNRTFTGRVKGVINGKKSKFFYS